MTIRQTKTVEKGIIKRITASFQWRKKSRIFTGDLELVESISLRDLNRLAEIQSTSLPESRRYLLENFQLNPNYRRFVSPRKILGGLIDKIKNKFYYETHHFIGGIVDKQELINRHSANAINRLVEDQERIGQKQEELADGQKALISNQDRIVDHLANLQKTLKKIQSSLERLEKDHSESLAELAKTAEIEKKRAETSFSLVHSYLDSTRREFSIIREDLQAQKEAVEGHYESIEKLSQSLDKRIHNLKYPNLDFNYVDFEKQFYGDYESLQKKHAKYLPWLEGCGNVLDIGCGSGAFLGLLKRNNIPAHGIDFNPRVIEDAAAHDIRVIQADAITYLQAQPDESFDAIGCFHVIEHMHPEDFLLFLKLCYQKLQSGGKLLLETPNATMLGIFMKGFYMDLSHIRPIHPQTAEFVLKDLGFSSVETFTSSQLPEGDRLKKLEITPGNATPDNEILNENLDNLNVTLYGDQDLSIIAQK